MVHRPGIQAHALKRSREITIKVSVYVILFSLSFVFLYPILFMISQSFMRMQDIGDATVQWIPKSLSFENFLFSIEWMKYGMRIKNTALITLLGSLAQICGCAIAGYGFARYRFPGYSIFLILLLFTFLVPPQSITVPLFLFFSNLKWTNTFWPFAIPALFGHGLRGALFVLVFMQFFRGLPHQLEEAARIDGAGAYRAFTQIMFPLAKPAIVVVFLFSVVWHWNDTFFPNLYLATDSKMTINQALGAMYLVDAGEATGVEDRPSPGDTIGSLPTNNEKVMAGALLSILPLLILYLFTQRYFVESVERTGIAGE